MCGLVGMASALKYSDEKTFKTLLLLDYFRGQDSTGFAAIRKDGAVETLKVADDPIILFNHGDFDQTLLGTLDAIWIGHNRAATIGVTNRANAHPFTAGHITGAHNGTLEKSSFQDIASRLPETYGTDSETIFAHIAKYGIDETVSRLRGAWALIWYDSNDKTLNMLKNDQRPLYTCEIRRDGGTALLWASEYQMISAALKMADVKDELIRDQEGYCFFPLPDDTLHTWALEDLKQGLVVAEVRPLKGLPPFPKPPAVVTTPYTPSTPYTPPAVVVVEDKINVVEIEIVEEPGKFMGGLLGEDEWNDMASYGCCYCGADVHPKDEGLLICLQENVVLCRSCSGESVTTIIEPFVSIPVNS